MRLTKIVVSTPIDVNVVRIYPPPGSGLESLILLLYIIPPIYPPFIDLQALSRPQWLLYSVDHRPDLSALRDHHDILSSRPLSRTPWVGCYTWTHRSGQRRWKIPHSSSSKHQIVRPRSVSHQLAECPTTTRAPGYVLSWELVHWTLMDMQAILNCGGGLV